MATAHYIATARECLILELPKEAQALGIKPGTRVSITVDTEGITVPHSGTPEDRTLALLAQWREEDETDDPEELERRDAATEALLKNLEADRLTLRRPES